MAPGPLEWTPLQKWWFYIGSPLSLLSWIFLVVVFYKYKHMRKPPGNMLLATILCEMLIYWEIFYNAIIYMVYGHVLDDEAWKVIGGMTVYIWHWGQNYFTCLAFEIMYRILRPTDLAYTRRFIIYTLCSHLPCIAYISWGIAIDGFGLSPVKNWAAKKGS